MTISFLPYAVGVPLALANSLVQMLCTLGLISMMLRDRSYSEAGYFEKAFRNLFGLLYFSSPLSWGGWPEA